MRPYAAHLSALSPTNKKEGVHKNTLLLEAPSRFELEITELQSIALPLGYSALALLKKKADYEARTRYLHLGKVALYQMS